MIDPNTAFDLNQIHALYMQHVTYDELGEIFNCSAANMHRMIKVERTKDPEKWPKRTRSAKFKPASTRRTRRPLEASFPPLPLRGSMSSPVVVYTLSQAEIAEIERKYPKRQATNTDGIPYKEPMVIGSDGRSHAKS